MLATRRTEINRIASKVRVALELNQVPFPVEDAVSRLGGKIEELPVSGGDAMVKKVGPAFAIHVAPQPKVRRRFSVAHELGHLFLHMGFILDPSKWAEIDEYRDSPKFRFGFTEEEFEAHEFAAALLMPADEFRQAAGRLIAGGRVELDALAGEFDVSTDAARVRGQWLGMFEWNR